MKTIRFDSYEHYQILLHPKNKIYIFELRGHDCMSHEKIVEDEKYLLARIMPAEKVKLVLGDWATVVTFKQIAKKCSPDWHCGDDLKYLPATNWYQR